MLGVTGYVLTFDDEFTFRSISQTGAGTTWADIRSQWRYDVYRSYDTVTNTHFFTASTAERDSVIAHLPSLHYEGVAFQAYASAGADTVTLERFYDATTHLHHFALSDEAEGMRHGSAGPNWVDEGPGLVVGTARPGAP